MNEATQKVALEEGSHTQEKRAYVARAYAAAGPTSGLAAATIRRREPGPEDVQIEILYCGVCHSDLHQVRNEWSGVMPTVYPCVPGHEIVGRVTKVGSAVSKFKLGDLAAVGCMVDSDRVCPECQAGLEQFCANLTLTYNSPEMHPEKVDSAWRPELSEMVVRLVRSDEQRRYQQLMRAHHYLGYLPKIGETLWYVATWRE